MKAKRQGTLRHRAGTAHEAGGLPLQSLPRPPAPRGAGTSRRRRPWLAGVALLLGACTRPLQPCRSPSACPENEECLAQRCLPVGAEPVDPSSRRLVLEPVQLAVVRTHENPQPGVPPTVSLGGPSEQSEQLLVRFAQSWLSSDVDAAFLSLQAAAAAEPSADDVRIEVALASGSWSSGTVGDAPSTRSPSSSGVGRTRPPAALRVDVTAQLRELAEQPERDRGFVVRASGESVRSAVYSTGTDGFGPRLDVYFRPRSLAR